MNVRAVNGIVETEEWKCPSGVKGMLIVGLEGME